MGWSGLRSGTLVGKGDRDSRPPKDSEQETDFVWSRHCGGRGRNQPKIIVLQSHRSSSKLGVKGSTPGGQWQTLPKDSEHVTNKMGQQYEGAATLPQEGLPPLLPARSQHEYKGRRARRRQTISPSSSSLSNSGSRLRCYCYLGEAWKVTGCLVTIIWTLHWTFMGLDQGCNIILQCVRRPHTMNICPSFHILFKCSPGHYYPSLVPYSVFTYEPSIFCTF